MSARGARRSLAIAPLPTWCVVPRYCSYGAAHRAADACTRFAFLRAQSLENKSS